VSERLNKVLSRAGVASRRAADRLITEGRVRVNGEVVRELGLQVDPQRDAIRVDGRRIPSAPAVHTYLMLNKPRGYVTTLADPENRPTVLDLLSGVKVRVFPVGRLDYLTEGLLLLTDDGELARDLMHPRSGVAKTYAAKVPLDGRPTLPARVNVKRPGANAWLEVSVVEGRKHQVRRMLEAIGHPVVKLRRVRYDGLELGDLPSGRVRPLTPLEIARLRRAVASGRRPSHPRRTRGDST
jgi:23S rRNA pseudouridine2605 synthase